MHTKLYSNFLDMTLNRYVYRSPIALTHLVTSMCNARCKMCDLWKKSSEYKKDMTTDEIFQMLDKARKSRMVGYVAWGGEPLMRRDLPEILKYAQKKKITTTVITNGFF